MKSLLGWRWILGSILVIVISVLFIRLGFWQLDRLAQRKALNAKVESEILAPPLNLNQEYSDPQLTSMQYRQAIVIGQFDVSHEILLNNQVWNGQLGYHILTPLILQGSNEYVLVDRGWIPYADGRQGKRYDVNGLVSVNGMILLSQTGFDLNSLFAGGSSSNSISDGLVGRINLDQIQKQIGVVLLPIYIQEIPDPSFSGYPERIMPTIDLSDGPHLSYAIQWFSFTAILLVVFMVFIRRKLRAHSETRNPSYLPKDHQNVEA
ncbi:MAG TPA: SURF1 family protein [Anaerolineaceae bacterium]|nr:SURF1 family protein [Anaerolineaceae bacterium]